MKNLIPNGREPLVLEHRLIESGKKIIVGIDEVGRGCIAGPVVAAAVILDMEKLSIASKIRDSKKITPANREKYFDILQNECLSIGIGFIDHQVIDKINILQATFEAMKIAISQLKMTPDVYLVDGNQKIPMDIEQLCIPKGDDLITSIGAASIIAKVTRDRWMKTISEKYPHYLFEKNKGYGTAEHIDAIRNHGFSEIHRRSFQINL
ncbi:MAG: ribonuclease HII [Proteobacteria bacterium]|jgi:ribonuclease HII|nr:ribonuclease HII [Pseudomonadota bacterium]